MYIVNTNFYHVRFIRNICFFNFIFLLTLCLLRIKFYKSKLKNKICNNCCPVYTKPLDRHKRKKYVKEINNLTLNIFGFKRIYCNNCKWTGLLVKYTKKIK